MELKGRIFYELSRVDNIIFNIIFYNFISTIPLAADYTNTLHATWQHGDTIYYGIRRRGENWIVLGDPLPQYGYLFKINILSLFDS